jgi:3-deoxy-D-manno-octulosonate 8-phosphate phosphatase KdsC-like HAD superfamily phosphatase
MKNKLKEILKNPKGKLIAVDLDGTLSEGEWWGLENEPEPKPIMMVFL